MILDKRRKVSGGLPGRAIVGLVLIGLVGIPACVKGVVQPREANAETIYAITMRLSDPSVEVRIENPTKGEKFWAGDLLAIDTVAKKILHRFRFGDIVRDTAFSSDGKRLYVSVSNKLVVIDTTTNQVVKQIPLEVPAVSAFTLGAQDDSKIYLRAGRGHISYDVTRNEIKREVVKAVGAIPVATVNGPVCFGIGDDAHKTIKMYELPTNRLLATLPLTDFDKERYAFRRPTPVPGGKKTVFVVQIMNSPRPQFIMGMRVFVIDTVSKKISSIELPAPAYPRGIDVTKDGKLLYVGTLKGLAIFDLQKMTSRKIDLPVQMLALSSDGSKLYKALQQNGIDVVSTTTFKKIDHMDITANYILSRTTRTIY